jgi:hypothetical protein
VISALLPDVERVNEAFFPHNINDTMFIQCIISIQGLFASLFFSASDTRGNITAYVMLLYMML